MIATFRICLLGACFSVCGAQPDTAVRVRSLEKILAIAAVNAPELEIIGKEISAAKAEVQMYRANAMPNVSIGSGASYVSQSQAVQKLQQQLLFSTFSSPSDQSADPDAGDVSFSYPDRINGYSFDWSLNLQQPLITFGKIRSAIRLARIRDCTLKETRRMREDLFYLRVIQEFSDAFLAQQDVAINRAALDRSLQLQTRVSTEFEGGRANRRELLRIQSLVQGDRAQLIAAEGAACISARRLIETVNPDDAGETRFEIDREGALSVPPPETGPGNIRLSLKRNEAAMYKEQIRFLRAGFFPSVDFIASINNQFMTIDTGGLAEQFIPRGVPDRDAVIGNLARQFDDANPKPGKYFDPDFFNYTVGLQLSWTIFNGFRTRAQYRQTKHLAEKSLLELEVMDREQDLAVEEARILLKTADSTIASVTTQLKAARMALSQTEKDYADGFSDFSTLLDTDKEYRDAVRALNGLTIQRLLALTQLRIALGLPVYGDTR